MNKYLICKEKNIAVLGRHTVTNDKVNLFWTASGIEFNISASELWVTFISDYNVSEPWISIEINGSVISRMMLTRGEHTVCIFRNMSAEGIKRIRILRDSQAMAFDEKCILQVVSVTHDGVIHKPESKTYKFEFIGDSITSGEGLFGASSDMDWTPMFMGAFNSYAVKTSDNFNAEFRVISQSGWGIVSSWDNNPHNTIPGHYKQICAMIQGKYSTMLGASKTNNFLIWQPDVIVINLGSNDHGALEAPEWRDINTGEVFKQEADGVGKPTDRTVQNIKLAVEIFLSEIRLYNLKAHIIWAYGMIDRSYIPLLQKAVEIYKTKHKDNKVSFCRLSAMSNSSVGSRKHPGILCHAKAAETLSHCIKEILKK